MAASSVGRRSCAGQREAAALISQSRRWFYRRVKRAAVRRLFFFAVVRQISGCLIFSMRNTPKLTVKARDYRSRN